MDDEREERLAKIKKMLALATSDNVSEAENAAAMAQEWLIKYNISEEELNEFNEEKNEKIIQVDMPPKNKRNRSRWHENLAHSVAQANLCKLVISGRNLIWIGKKTNVEIAQYIFENLVRDLTRIADIAWKEFNVKQRERGGYIAHGKNWKNSFYHGANQSISERLRANLIQLRESQNAVNALIVSNDSELKEYMHEHFPYLTATSYRLNRESTGFDVGRSVGRSVQFRSGVGAGGSAGPKLLGGGN